MIFVNEIIETIYKDRYPKNGETYEKNLERVADYCSKTDEDYYNFLKVMKNRYFFPAGRTMSNAGIGKNLTLNNCFIAPQCIDSLDSIFQQVALGAKVHQRGGGIGYDFSNIRPAGSPTSNEAIASGPVSFMNVFNAQTSTILQGNRRGANMGVLSVYNIDIEDFVTAKSKNKEALNHFNISVMVDDEFLKAAKENQDIDLHYPVYDESGNIIKDPNKWIYSKTINAKKLWDLITLQAHETGEPGVLFFDNMNKDNNTYYIEKIVGTNPCGEYLGGTVFGIHPKTGEVLNPADYGGACNLGSLLLTNFVIDPFTPEAKLDIHNLVDTIEIAVRMLDNIIDANTFPDIIFENYQKNFRTIGLGITGLADMLVMLGYRYDTLDATRYASDLMNFIAYHAYRVSTELAKEKGSFPFLDKDKFLKSGFLNKHLSYRTVKHKEFDCDWHNIIHQIELYGIRNARLLSIAPTGTLSLTFGNNCSSGIEPIFSLSYDRKVKIGGQDESNAKIVKMMDYAYYLADKLGYKKDCEEKGLFITATEMDVESHIEMLGCVTYHVDMSTSKTINVPESYTFEQTKNIYNLCHEFGIKGCTIYRPTGFRDSVLISKEEAEKNKEVNSSTSKANKEELKRGMILVPDDNVIGKKRKLITGCGSLHCEAWFDPDNGDLLEVFLSKGSKGGCENSLKGLSRMISLSARAGVGVDAIADQLESCGSCSSYAVRAAVKKDTSKGSCCPSAVAKAILEMYKDVQEEYFLVEEDEESEDKNNKLNSKIKKNNSKDNKEKNKNCCPICGDPVIPDGGCVYCISCGWSKCG